GAAPARVPRAAVSNADGRRARVADGDGHLSRRARSRSAAARGRAGARRAADSDVRDSELLSRQPAAAAESPAVGMQREGRADPETAGRREITARDLGLGAG